MKACEEYLFFQVINCMKSLLFSIAVFLLKKYFKNEREKNLK